MRKSLILLFLFIAVPLFSQTNLLMEGNYLNSTETGDWSGVNIRREAPTNFIYRNNTITSVNSSGYVLQAGDESVSDYNSNLNESIITGNKFIWNGIDPESITHGIFTGYNINVVIQFNYLYRVPMSVIRKSNGMTNTGGAVSYNIIKNSVATAIVVKGMNGVNIFNNTIYNDQNFYNGTDGIWRGLVDIYANDSPFAVSKGTKIKNNIFYTVHQIYNISIAEVADLAGFESDYNIFYCESGVPMFKYLGSKKTFDEWQDLGYDLHSIVIDPEFIDNVSFVPGDRLDYGISLGEDYKVGLSKTAVWGNGSPDTAHQSGPWQVGAVIHKHIPTDIEEIPDDEVKSHGGWGCKRSY